MTSQSRYYRRKNALMRRYIMVWLFMAALLLAANILQYVADLIL